VDTNARTKVLFVLGPAYSGSTLFGLALGRHDRILNLGEAINLHHDYREQARCTCGSPLRDCHFWQAMQWELAQRASRGECPDAGLLRDEGGRSAIDRRGGLVKLLYPLVSMSALYRRPVIDRYRSVSRALFGAAATVGDAEYVVDLSKSPERLEILSADPALELWCVFLERSAEAVYASTLARPKRTRARFGFKALRESFWLAYRRRHMQRVYRRIAPGRRMRVNVEAFEREPGRVMAAVFDWLGLQAPGAPAGNGQRNVRLRDQHVFVGNRWLFETQEQEVTIAPGTSPRPLTRLQRLAFRVFNAGSGEP
jgi:hypothetical protein